MRRPNVKRLRRRGDVDGLHGALTYVDLDQRRAGALVDRGADIRIAALDALAQDHPDRLDEALRQALLDKAPRVRHAALGVLSRDPSGIQAACWTTLAYAVAFWPADDQTRRPAVHLLAERAGALPVLDAHVEGALDAGVVSSALLELHDASPPASRDRATRTLINAVADNGDPSRAAAAEAGLRELGSRAALHLIAAVDAGRREPPLIDAVTASRADGASACLASLLADESVVVRRHAARGLVELVDPRTLEPLLRASADPDYEVRVAAIAAIDRFRPIATLIAATSRPDVLRQEIIGSAGTDAPPRAQLATGPTPFQTRARSTLERFAQRRKS